jgi:hypothetical protein
LTQGEYDVITIRASSATKFLFAAIGLFVCLPSIVALHLGRFEGMVGSAIAAVPVSRCRISLNEDVLAYRGFISTQQVRFSEIKRFDIHGPAQDNWIGPTLGLRIFSASSNEPVLTVNIKPFASRDIKRLTDRLTQAIGGA